MKQDKNREAEERTEKQQESKETAFSNHEKLLLRSKLQLFQEFLIKFCFVQKC